MNNILPFPVRDATVKRHPLEITARRALAGDAQALGAMVEALGISRPEIELAKRALGSEPLLDACEVEQHLVGQLAHALLFTPVWVVHTHAALKQLTARNFHKLSVDLPYACMPTADTNALCLVTRDYKPLGCPESWGYIPYDDAAVRSLVCITRSFFQQLQGAGVVTPAGYFTDRYCSPSGGPAALAEYKRRVRVLLSPWVRL
jgi:hypothetical protein